ncbi:hypothetical protein DXG01_012807, partial [Tephrocybe rancida]
APEKRPVSQESLDEDDEQAFEQDFQAEETYAQLAKGKKGKGKKSDVKGPFKSGPIPDEAKQLLRSRYRTLPQKSAKHRSYSSRSLVKVPCSRAVLRLDGAPSKRGMEFTEKSRSIKILASPQEWTKIVSAERGKYCQAKLGDKWEDPEALTKLFEPIMAWYLEKHETYVEELKLEGTFDKVVGKVQHEYMRL